MRKKQRLFLRAAVVSVFMSVGLFSSGFVRAEAPAPVGKTGQTTSYAPGDDGDWQAGLSSPVPRFTDNGDGTVSDNLTGLIWLKNARCFYSNWLDALSNCNTLNSGECGLSDGSVEGDWRLPNLKELQSLLDYGRYNPCLPLGHPFSVASGGGYWSSTTHSFSSYYAWEVQTGGAYVFATDKTQLKSVWPVRGPEPIDPTPDIKANDSDGPLTISNATDDLEITVSLDAGSYSGKDAEFWVQAIAPNGDKYWYVYGTGEWVKSATPVRGRARKCTSFSPITILDRDTMPVGTWLIIFAIDLDVNDMLDLEPLFKDKVSVTVNP